MMRCYFLSLVYHADGPWGKTNGPARRCAGDAFFSLFTGAFHGRDGPIGVTPAPLTPLTKAYIQGGKEMGHPFVDYNGPEQLGKVTTWYYWLTLYMLNPRR